MIEKTKTRHFLKGTVALGMALSICAGTLPVFAGTEPSEKASEKASEKTAEPDDYGYDAETGELTDLREANVKHFRLADGNCQAVAYADAVHRRDSNGVWRDIDNRLEEKAVKDSLLSKAESTLLTTGDRMRSFARSASERELVTIRDGEHILSMGLVNAPSEAAKSVASVKNHEKPSRYGVKSGEVDVQSVATADTTTQVVYRNVIDGVDLEYQLTGNDVKENIILNSRSEGDYRYAFELYLTGLTAESLPGGEIGLYDSKEGDLVYRMPAPFMYDGKGAYSDAVAYELTERDGRQIVVVEASSDWINAEERVFPVTIDPSVASRNLYDTYISSGFPSTNYGSSGRVWISNEATAYYAQELPTLPDSATITSATLSVLYYFLIT